MDLLATHDEFPKPELTRLLKSRCTSLGLGGQVHNLVDYDGVRYHFFLEHNTGVEVCEENRYIEKVIAAFEESRKPEALNSKDREIQSMVSKAVAACAELFWPFFKERSNPGLGKDTQEERKSER